MLWFWSLAAQIVAARVCQDLPSTQNYSYSHERLIQEKYSDSINFGIAGKPGCLKRHEGVLRITSGFESLSR